MKEVSFWSAGFPRLCLEALWLSWPELLGAQLPVGGLETHVINNAMKHQYGILHKLNMALISIIVKK